MPGIDGAVSLLQKLNSYERSHQDEEKNLVVATYSGRTLSSVATTTDPKDRAIKKFNQLLKREVSTPVPSTGLTLRAARAALLHEVVTYFNQQYPNVSAADVTTTVERILQDHPLSDTGQIIDAISQKIGNPGVAPEEHDRPMPVDVTVVAGKVDQELHETGDKQEQVSGTEFSALAAGKSDEHRRVFAEFQAECQQIMQSDEFIQAKKLLSNRLLMDSGGLPQQQAKQP